MRAGEAMEAGLRECCRLVLEAGGGYGLVLIFYPQIRSDRQDSDPKGK